MDTSHHGPLGNGYVLLSLLGFLLGFALWGVSPSWGFLLILVSLITFIASFISATRAPLLDDDEMQLAIHERYYGNRYPDTDLHHGHIKKDKIMHSRHKKKLVELHLDEKNSSKKTSAKRSSAKKASRKKPAKKKSVGRPAKSVTRKTANKGSTKKSSRNAVKKASRKKPAKKSRKR